jgi:hypothetical protein
MNLSAKVDTELRGFAIMRRKQLSVSAVVQPIAQSLLQALTWKGGLVISHRHG